MSSLSPLATKTRQPVLTTRIAPPVGRSPRGDVYNAFESAPGQANRFLDAPGVKPGHLPLVPGQQSTHSLKDGGSSMFSQRDSEKTSLTNTIVTTAQISTPKSALKRARGPETLVDQPRRKSQRLVGSEAPEFKEASFENVPDFLPPITHKLQQANRLAGEMRRELCSNERWSASRAKHR
jgi:hypothetical protein